MLLARGAILTCLISAVSVTKSGFVQAQPASPTPAQAKAQQPVGRVGFATLSGKWSGTLQIPGPNGRDRSIPMYLILKQEGTTLAGWGGPDLGELNELANGKVEGDQVRFDLHDHANLLHASLIRRADRLAGDLTRAGKPALRMSVAHVSYPTVAQLQTPLAEIDTMVEAELAKGPVGSVTIGVVSGPQLIWTKSYGDANREKRTPATQNTVYRIGSITKTFTAVMLFQLVQDGKIRLSDPVEKYFPEVKTIQGRHLDAPPITLFQLATHTAGLSREPDDAPTYLKGPVSEWEKILISALPHTHYQFEPGIRHSYSNIGYAILGASLGRAIGEPYTEHIRKRIFKPLGMEHSAFEPNPAIRPTLSKGYSIEEGKVDSETSQREHEGRGSRSERCHVYDGRRSCPLRLLSSR